MSEKKRGEKPKDTRPKKSLKKIGVAAAAGVLLGLGVEEGARQIEKVDAADLSAPSMVEEKTVVSEPSAVSQVSTAEENHQPDEDRRKKDLERTQNVKKFINKIYEAGRFVDNPNENITDRHAKLKEFLERKFGDKYVIGEVKFITDPDGKREYYFHAESKNADGSSGESVEVDYEDDGSISVEDEGVASFINIKNDEKMTDNMASQMDKAIRMRLEARRYTFDQFYLPDEYEKFLKNEGYDDAQINYIMHVKGKNLEDVMKGIDNK